MKNCDGEANLWPNRLGNGIGSSVPRPYAPPSSGIALITAIVAVESVSVSRIR